MQGPQGPTKRHACPAWRQLCIGPLERDAFARAQQSQGTGRLNLGFSLRERGEQGLQARGPAFSTGCAGLRVWVRAGSGVLHGALGCLDHHGPELGFQEMGLRCRPAA